MAITKTQGKFSKGIDDNATSTAITIDSSESVSVSPSGGVITLGASGQVTSKQSLDVATAGGRYIGSSNRGIVGQIRIEQTATGADGGYLEFDTCASGSTSPTKRMRLDTDGLKFGNDTAAANALNDYEEGTWTPAYGATTGSFSSVSYQNQIGTYAKVGNIVTAHGRIDTTGSSIGTASGYLLITGFPYASVSAYQSGPCAYSWGFSSVHPTAVSFQGSSSSAYLFAADRAPTTGSIVPSNLASGSSTSYLYFGITSRTT